MVSGGPSLVSLLCSFRGLPNPTSVNPAADGFRVQGLGIRGLGV